MCLTFIYKPKISPLLIDSAFFMLFIKMELSGTKALSFSISLVSLVLSIALKW